MPLAPTPPSLPALLSPRQRAAPALLMLAALLLSLLGCLLHPATAAEPGGAVGVLPRLDLVRYAGTWYELARAPNAPQRTCVADVVTRYHLVPGALRLEGTCRRSDGSTQALQGLARPLAAGDARLQLSVMPSGLRWLPLGRSDYWVVALDPGYRMAAISDRNGALRWVLSREPHVAPEGYAALLGHLRERGFAIDRLQPTLQLAAGRPGMRRALWAMH